MAPPGITCENCGEDVKLNENLVICISNFHVLCAKCVEPDSDSEIEMCPVCGGTDIDHLGLIKDESDDSTESDSQEDCDAIVESHDDVEVTETDENMDVDEDSSMIVDEESSDEAEDAN